MPISGVLPGREIVSPDAILSGNGGQDIFTRRYPSWMYRRDDLGVRELVTPKTPEKTQFDEWIQADIMRHGPLMARFRRELRFYRKRVSGVFPGFDPDVDQGFVSSEIPIQVAKVCAMGMTTPIQINYPNRTRQEREDAQAMEAFANWFLEQWRVHHRMAINADLVWDMFWYSLVYGRIVVQQRCDLEDSEFPWWTAVEDPATCFPLEGKGKHGMIRMSRQYTALAADVLDMFDPMGEKRLAEKLNQQAEREYREFELDREVVVTECDTRWSHYVAVDDIEVLRTDHEYGFVPYIYNLVGGEATTSGVGVPIDVMGPSGPDIVRRGWGAEGGTSRQFDLVEKGQSFFHNVIPALLKREEILSLHMTVLQQTVWPSTITTTPYDVPPEPMDLTPGKDNLRRTLESTAPAIPHPAPVDTGPLLAQVDREIEAGMLPRVIFGQIDEGNNITGFAQDSLIAAAKDRIQPNFDVVQATISDVIFMATGQFYDFGHTAEGLANGELIIPRQNRRSDFTNGGKVAPIPPYAQSIIMAMLKNITEPGGPLGPPPPPAPTGPPSPFAQPPAQPPTPDQGAAMMGANPMAMGIGMPGPQIGMPGFLDPRWTMTGKPPVGDAPEFRITRDIIENISYRPRVKLNAMSLNSRTTLINYLTQAVGGKFMRRETAMEQIPEVRDTLEEFEGIIAEDAITNSELLQAVYYPRSLYAQGDFEGFLLYWAVINLPRIMASMGMPLGGGPGPMGMGAMGPPPQDPNKGQAPIEQPPGPVANNAAAQGRGPGSRGAPVGRPG